jgi:hypothetical protein
VNSVAPSCALLLSRRGSIFSERDHSVSLSTSHSPLEGQPKGGIRNRAARISTPSFGWDMSGCLSGSDRILCKVLQQCLEMFGTTGHRQCWDVLSNIEQPVLPLHVSLALVWKLCLEQKRGWRGLVFAQLPGRWIFTVTWLAIWAVQLCSNKGQTNLIKTY